MPIRSKDNRKEYLSDLDGSAPATKNWKSELGNEAYHAPYLHHMQGFSILNEGGWQARTDSHVRRAIEGERFGDEEMRSALERANEEEVELYQSFSDC